MNSPVLNVRLEPYIIKLIDKVVQKGIAKNRSDLIRKALLEYLSKYVEIDDRMVYLLEL